MLLIRTRYWILCIACIIYTPVFAQDTNSAGLPAIWDLQTCLQYARENNIQLNSLRLNQQTSEQQLLLSKSAVLPDLYGTASQSVRNTGGPSSGIKPSGSYGVSSSWTLYKGGYLLTDIKQKDLSVQSANLYLLAGENDITLQITQAYLAILLDKESIVYAEDLTKTSQAQVEEIKRKFDVGSVARKDVVQLEAQLAGDQYTLNSSQNTEREDKLTLKQLLQLPTITSFDIVKPDTIVSQALIPSLQQVQIYALQNRPEIKNGDLGIQIAELSLDKAQSGYKPSISAGAGIGTSYANDPGNNIFRQFDNNFYQQVGLSLSIPIFTKQLNNVNVQEAKIGIKQSELTAKDIRTNLLQTVERAYINVQNAQTQYNSALEQLQYVREIYRIANEELRLGAANIVQFYQQRTLYVQALQLYIRAKYNAALSVKIYEFYNGVAVKL